MTEPNQRVEVNRHQPPCLPGRFDFMIATAHSNLLVRWRSLTQVVRPILIDAHDLPNCRR